MAAMEGVAPTPRASSSGVPGTDVIVSSGSVQQDAFDRDDFDAVAYINEMFPTGPACFVVLLGHSVLSQCPLCLIRLDLLDLLDLLVKCHVERRT